MKKTQLVGILNCTPDSYFENSRRTDPEEAIAYALHLFEEGADIVDIGGESTRPISSTPLFESEEIARVVPVIKGLRAQTDRPISIDTYRPRVAEAALDAGANFLNDITGFCHPEMRRLARESRVPICVMHMLGEPHSNPLPEYPNGVVDELMTFFQKRIELLVDEGVDPSQIILDPGIGGGAFGKNVDQSFQILKNLKRFHALGFPLYISLSRKSFLQKILKKPASEILSTTIALNTMSLLEGVDYIRVHDVGVHRDIMTVVEHLQTV